jgi:hypothetical protein
VGPWADRWARGVFNRNQIKERQEKSKEILEKTF